MTDVFVVAAIAVAALVLLRHGNEPGCAAARAGRAFATRACRPQITDGVLPGWARDGFSQTRPRMRYALGRSGRIAAILWVTLESPPAANRDNKILWVSRVPTRYGHALTIHAQRMRGTRRVGNPVTRTVTGGPGPSIINLPAPGCRRFTLRWSRSTDQRESRRSPPRYPPVPVPYTTGCAAAVIESDIWSCSTTAYIGPPERP